MSTKTPYFREIFSNNMLYYHMKCIMLCKRKQSLGEPKIKN